MPDPIVILFALAGGIYAVRAGKKINKREKEIEAKAEVFRRALTSGTKVDEDISMMTASQSESDRLLTEQIFEAARKEDIDPYKELGIEPPTKVPNCMAGAMAAARFSGYASMIPGCGIPMGIDIHNQHSEPVEIAQFISHFPDFKLPDDHIPPPKAFSQFITDNVKELHTIYVYRQRSMGHYNRLARVKLMVPHPKARAQSVAEYCMRVIQDFIDGDDERGIYKVVINGGGPQYGKARSWEKQKHVDTREQSKEEVEEQR